MSIKGGPSATRRRALLGAFVTTVVIGLTAGVAAAGPGTGSPSDARAEYNTGNIQMGDCPAGTVDVTGSVTANVVGGTNLNITAVNAGVTVTDIFVKGGPDYNLYEPGQRGLSATPPWSNLISPLNQGGNVPTISHWFACGTTGGGTTTTQPEETTTTTQPEETTTTTQPEETTTTTQPEETTTTTQPEETTTTQPGGETTTTQPEETTTTTQPEETTTTTQPEESTTTTTVSGGGGTTTTARATTTTTKLPTTGSSNVGAVVAIALIALGAGGGAIVLARRKFDPAD